MDGAEHARLRGLVSRVFTARRVETLRPAIRTIAARLVDDLRAAAGDPVDLAAAWALPLPIAVIGDLLGIPAADLVGFAERVTTFGLALEPTLGPDDPGPRRRIVPRYFDDRPTLIAILRSFVEEMKASGFVAKALEASGQAEAAVAQVAAYRRS